MLPSAVGEGTWQSVPREESDEGRARQSPGLLCPLALRDTMQASDTVALLYRTLHVTGHFVTLLGVPAAIEEWLNRRETGSDRLSVVGVAILGLEVKRLGPGSCWLPNDYARAGREQGLPVPLKRRGGGPVLGGPLCTLKTRQAWRDRHKHGQVPSLG